MTNIAIERDIRNRTTRQSSNLPYITIGIRQKLNLQDIHSFIANALKVKIGDESYVSIEESRGFLQSCIENRLPIYGTNTNFGDQVYAIDPYLNDVNVDLYYESI